MLGSAVYALELVWPDRAAALLVGGATYIVSLFFVGGGISRLKARILAPQASAESLRRDTETIKEHMS